MKSVPQTVTHNGSLAYLLDHTLINVINQKVCCLPITQFILVFLKWFFFLAIRFPNRILYWRPYWKHCCFVLSFKMVKLAHLFLSLFTYRQGNGQTCPSPWYGLDPMQTESYLIYLWRLFSLTRRRTNCPVTGISLTRLSWVKAYRLEKSGL